MQSIGQWPVRNRAARAIIAVSALEAETNSRTLSLSIRSKNNMAWISEMFANMEKDKAAASSKRSAKAAKGERIEHLKKQIPCALDAWNALVSSITNDVCEFNKRKERAGQAAVHMSHRRFRCEVYLPGMQSKRLVLTLDNNDLRVSVHPDFPTQQSAITIEPDKDGQHGSWVPR